MPTTQNTKNVVILYNKASIIFYGKAKFITRNNKCGYPPKEIQEFEKKLIIICIHDTFLPLKLNVLCSFENRL